MALNKQILAGLVLFFNNNVVQESSSQNHLGTILDSKLNFKKHLRTISTNVNKTTGLLRKLQITLPRQSLLAIYKAFFRPRLDLILVT